MKQIYVLIWVHHGLIQNPELFSKRIFAEKRKKYIKMTGFNTDYDEIMIFKKRFTSLEIN